jgi:hypothetical protein
MFKTHSNYNSSTPYPISFTLDSNLVSYITSPKEEITTYLLLGLYKAWVFFLL